jgi:hypothetical protein
MPVAMVLIGEVLLLIRRFWELVRQTAIFLVKICFPVRTWAGLKKIKKTTFLRTKVWGGCLIVKLSKILVAMKTAP